MLGQRNRRQIVAAVAGTCLVAALLTPSALATGKPKPKTTMVAVKGNAKAGKTLFVSTCGTCHTLKAAGTGGTLGPNLDKLAPLTEATIIKQIDNGGAALFTAKYGAAAAAKYQTPMPSIYKSQFSSTQIENIAAFVYTALAADK
jgi:mono/diheme cytochrome c family protein